MSPTIAPDPAATVAAAFAPDDLGPVDVMPVDVVSADVEPDDGEREKLRLEFEAIIAAGYRGGADEPRPSRPNGRVATKGGGRPVDRPAVPRSAARPERLLPAPPPGPVPRERGPPAPRLAR